jgi:hypothetical protein
LKALHCIAATLVIATFPACHGYSRVAPARGPAFDVGVFGDMPYISSDTVREEKTEDYRRALASISAHPMAFAVHIGDISAGGQCSDSIYAQRSKELSDFAHPLILLFGDNEWTDCRAPFEPLERLARLRQLFAPPGGATLGRTRFPVERQSADPRFSAYSENAKWTRSGVVFVTLNVVGSNNNWGTDSTASAEHRARTLANLAWLRSAFADAKASGAAGVAVFMHANPLPSAAARAARPNGFAPITTLLRELALDYDRPVALVHGDTHYFRVDKPFEEAGTFKVYGRITRAETFGDPNSHWLRMTVNPDDPDVFSFRPMLVPGNIKGGH